MDNYLSLINNDITVALFILFGLALCYQTFHIIPEKLVAARLLETTIYIIAFSLIISLIVYTLLRLVSTLDPNFDTWVIALDIALANIFITYLLIFEFYFFFNSFIMPTVVKVILVLLLIVLALLKFLLLQLIEIIKYIVNRFRRNQVAFKLASPFFNSDRGSLFGCLLELLEHSLPPVFSLLGSLFLVKLLLIDTVDLQEILFGSYDGSLGLVYYPTSFRLTVLLERAKSLSSNQTLMTILGFIGAAVSLIVVVVSIIQAVSQIGEFLKSKNES